MDGEDRRAAANLIATTTGHLVTTALAVLAVIGAFVTFTIDKRDAEPFFFVCIAVSSLLMIFSIIAGVYGEDDILRHVRGGSFPTSIRAFQLQLYLLVLSVIVLPFSFLFFGQSKEESLDRLQKQLAETTEQVHALESQIQRLNDEVAALKEP